jgi:hypothetical protein
MHKRFLLFSVLCGKTGVRYAVGMKRIVKSWVLALLAVLLVVEEWLWDTLTLAGRALSRRLHLERLEAWLMQAPRHMALLAFLMPLLLVTPLNIAALWMIAKGMVLRGILLQIFMKLVGTLLIARVFALTRVQLLTYRWFAWLYNTITRWLRWAHARLAATRVYRLAKAAKAQLREGWQRWRVRLKVWLG